MIAFRELGEAAEFGLEREATIRPRSGDEEAGALEVLSARGVQSSVGFTSQRGTNSFWTVRLPNVGVPGSPGSAAAWVEVDKGLVLKAPVLHPDNSIRSFRSLMMSPDERDKLRCCLLASSLGLLPDVRESFISEVVALGKKP